MRPVRVAAQILLTNVCIYDCLYCVNRVSSDVPRARFTVDEVVTLTLDFSRRNCIEGLFLSSGVIRNPDVAPRCSMPGVLVRSRETRPRALRMASSPPGDSPAASPACDASRSPPVGKGTEFPMREAFTVELAAGGVR